MVQPEFNKEGTEVWNAQDQPLAIVIVDDETLQPKHVIKGDAIVTPIGKFNVYNARNDVY